MEANLIWGITLTLTVIGVCGAWFYLCGCADKARQVRIFARRTLFYAGPGFILGLALVTSDLGGTPMGVIAFTTCCGLLVYSAAWAVIASDDDTMVMVNLTGRALLLVDRELAPFYRLPARQDAAATELPPIFPRTCYVVSSALGQLAAQAGRSDMLTIDAATATDYGDAGLLVRRLNRAAPIPAGCETALD